ncbi:MAG: carbonic anhydrase [Verrucomicrobia bacterium]|nr:carbonic anhydrase [Verrucomicrobiota bacterium]
MKHAPLSLSAAVLRAAFALPALVLLPLRASEAAHAAPAAAAPATPAPAAAAPAAATPPPAAPAAAPVPVKPAPAAHVAPPAAKPAAHAKPAHAAPVSAERPSPEDALQRLLDGNARFVAGHAEHPNQSVARRVETAAGQAPFAVILTCSDSRVSPEFYFDQGIGDLFVVRDAGNTLNDHVIGSIEYAVEHLHASIVLVVGHEKCGAVAAAIAGGRADGRIGTIIEAIRPAVKETRNQSGDKTDNAIRSNARRAAQALTATGPIISHAVQSGEIKIFAARYDLDSGRIELIP